MEEVKQPVFKKSNYSAIVEMSQTDGWKEIQAMLEYDEKFALALLTQPKPLKTSEDGKILGSGAEEWVKDEHGLGFARGILRNARKYLRKVRNAQLRANQQQE